VQDEPGSGQPKRQRTDANVDRVRADPRLGVRLTAEEGYGRRKRPELWPDEWILHPDNALAQFREFMANKYTTKLTIHIIHMT
jgi:hypothetical protein